MHRNIQIKSKDNFDVGLKTNPRVSTWNVRSTLVETHAAGKHEMAWVDKAKVTSAEHAAEREQAAKKRELKKGEELMDQ